MGVKYGNTLQLKVHGSCHQHPKTAERGGPQWVPCHRHRTFALVCRRLSGNHLSHIPGQAFSGLYNLKIL